MSIASISNAGSSNLQNWQILMRQRQQDTQNLASSLQSGDLSGAQQAYSDLQALVSTDTSGTSSTSSSPLVQQDFAKLGQDLSAGNLTQAQKDFSQFKTDFQSVLSQNGGAVHRHHGHHGHKTDNDSNSTNTDNNSNVNTLADALSNSTSNLLSQYGTNSTSSLASSIFSLIA